MIQWGTLNPEKYSVHLPYPAKTGMVRLSTRVRRRTHAVRGLPIMKFTLTYDGSLPASANKPKNKEKWEIRKHFHPQLKDLWDSHPGLKMVEENRYFPTTGGVLLESHHEHPGPLKSPFVVKTTNEYIDGIIDLNQNIDKHGVTFKPLVRQSYALHCGLKILFLRKEPPGKVYQGGDIDGRIKTLLDSLAMPQHIEQIIDDTAAPKPLFCLLEDDSMISGLHVESERLLTDINHSSDFVRLIIEVDVRVRIAKTYNQSFLG
jgi:hypothetical protein